MKILLKLLINFSFIIPFIYNISVFSQSIKGENSGQKAQTDMGQETAPSELSVGHNIVIKEFGKTEKTCQNFIDESKDKTILKQYEDVADGFLTASNIFYSQISHKSAQIGAQAKIEDRVSWLKGYCVKDPTASYGHALAELFLFLNERNL